MGNIRNIHGRVILHLTKRHLATFEQAGNIGHTDRYIVLYPGLVRIHLFLVDELVFGVLNEC